VGPGDTTRLLGDKYMEETGRDVEMETEMGGNKKDKKEKTL
jgi:hypothetical protein